MAFTLLYSVFEGIIANAPLMAVKAMNAGDAQLQLPLAMAAAGIFASVLLGSGWQGEARSLLVTPRFGGAIAALAMAWTSYAAWFLFTAGVISICDFATRPAIPSIMRIVYPCLCRSHVSGTVRQYASIVFLAATLSSAALLSAALRPASAPRF